MSRGTKKLRQKFQPTPPARTETSGSHSSGIPQNHFNPLRPRGRRPKSDIPLRGWRMDFNPLRPRGRRRVTKFVRQNNSKISTHSAREDGDGTTVVSSHEWHIISTHSAREDGDSRPPWTVMCLTRFQPTPPARTETNVTDCYPKDWEFQPTPPARTETS